MPLLNIKMFKMKVNAWTYSFVFLGCVFGCSYSVDPVLTWSSWTDSVGNTADANSDVTFAPIPMPANLSYKAGKIEYDSRGLEPMYNFAKAFINGAVFPYGISWDVIDKMINGTLMTDITTNYMDYVKQFGGFGAMFVTGFLFIFLFPMIGCCFCCCRCCNNCGGAMNQRPKDAANDCKRRTFATILFILIVFIAAGMATVYVTNNQMTDTIETFDSSATNVLDDISTFIDVFVGQMKHIAGNNFNFTRDVIFRDLDSIGYVLGIPARESLKTQGAVDTAINSALELTAMLSMAENYLSHMYDENIRVSLMLRKSEQRSCLMETKEYSVLEPKEEVDAISAALINVNTSLANVKDKASDLQTSASALKSGIETDESSCGGSCSGAPDVSTLDVNVDSNAFPDISDQVGKISSVQSQNLTAVVLQAKQQFDDVPWTVENETKTLINDLKSTVNDFSSTIQSMIDQADSFKSGMKGSFDVASYKDLIGSYTKLAMNYNTYRWYGGVGLTCFILLIVLLLFLGLLIAVCGHRRGAPPTERSCLSSCGGNMLMAAVGFVFIFSSFLMLLTTMIFIFGTPMHRFVCEPITDPDLKDMQTILDKYLYNYMYGGTGSFLGKAILQNASVSLTLKQILSDCRSGKSAYKAFQLSSMIDITQFTNISGSLNIDSQLDGINVDLSTLEILTPELTSQLEDLKTSANINFTQFREQISKDSLGINLTALAQDLRDFSTSINGSDPVASANFMNHANTADGINSNELAAFNVAMNDLEEQLNSLEASVNGTGDSVDITLAAFNDTQNFLQTNGSQLIKDEAKNFAKRLLKVATTLINDTLDGLENEIGACTPVWNLYNDIFVISFCKYLVDTLNGFWFGLGWCIFFFIPSIIFATKLAKHYRRMKKDDFEDPFEKSAIPLPEIDREGSYPVFKGKGHSPGFKQSKVSHADW